MISPGLAARVAVWGLTLGLACAVRADEPAGTTRPAVAATPRLSDVSYYLPMRDGVRLALSLWFPGGEPPAEPAPTLLVQTRYGRAAVFAEGEAGGGYRPYVEAGYVVAVVDTRGSTSSFGPREVDIGPDEVADMDEIIAHLAARPWSDGQVFVTGVSYMADTADVATSRAAPALKGGVIREADFDVWAHVFFPGGVKNEWFLQTWGEATRRMDLGLAPDPEQELDCRARAADCAPLFPTLQAVDGDDGFDLLRQALSGRRRWTPETYRDTEFRDDVAANRYPLFASSPAAHLAGIRKRALPVQYWGSWMDAGTAEAALARFRSAPEVPMEVWITANNHPNSVRADPFFPDDRAPRPSLEAQRAKMLDFLARVGGGARIERRIHYYVLGAGEFRSTDTWPPADARLTRFGLAPGRRLVSDAGSPADADASVERYAVDFAASSGTRTRWSTQFGTDPDYRDRRDADRRLLTFDTAPFESDMEIVGTPVVTLDLASRSRDPVVHAYLEDVAPDGTVTYLVEGALRLLHRRLADAADLPYDPGPAPHSFRRADALPMDPGEFARAEFALFPVAARIARGHRLRLALAGADADTFLRYPHGEPEEFLVRTGGTDPGGLTVPMRPWRTHR
jgi:hypothetical protein